MSASGRRQAESRNGDVGEIRHAASQSLKISKIYRGTSLFRRNWSNRSKSVALEEKGYRQSLSKSQSAKLFLVSLPLAAIVNQLVHINVVF